MNRVFSKTEVEMIQERNLNFHPLSFSEGEIACLFRQVRNLKHKSILYARGLRISEAINSEFTDINSDRNLILIRNGKGGKGRTILLSENMLQLLRTYYKEYHPKS